MPYVLHHSSFLVKLRIEKVLNEAWVFFMHVGIAFYIAKSTVRKRKR